jgi:hypothetical protein
MAKYEVYGIIRGVQQMKSLGALSPSDVEMSGQEIVAAMQSAVEQIKNGLLQGRESQVVIIHDGFIVGVENTATGKLVWCA